MPIKKTHTINIDPDIPRTNLIFNKFPTKNASPQQTEKIQQIVNEFQFQFYVDGDMLGKTDIIQHKIYLRPNSQIICTRQFRLSDTQYRQVISEAREMEAQGVIRKSCSPFNSPAFMVPKKDENGEMKDSRFATSGPILKM